jgi:hypothetical protein
MTGAALVAALATNLAHPERVELLSPFFEPRPAELIKVETPETGTLTLDQIADLRGYITVSPPKGACFEIIRGNHELPRKICKKERMSFRLDDLDNSGSLRWQIITGPKDFGTNLHWKSTYRRALTVPYTKQQNSDKDSRFIQNCNVVRVSEQQRVVHVKLFDGEVWSITFPEFDHLLPQPPPEENLKVVFVKGTRVIADASKTAAFKSGAEVKTKDEERNIDLAYDEAEDRKNWAIPRRGAYGIPSNHFTVGHSVTPGGKGECRYSFFGSNSDPETGRIECHNSEEYSYAFAPMTCLRDVGPKERKRHTPNH